MVSGLLKKPPMKKWLLKAAAQKAVSYLPAAHHVNYLVHKYITKGKHLPEEFFTDRLSHFTNHYRFLKQFHPHPEPQLNVLELGTGWHPIVPIAFFLSGHTDIITIDIRPQLFPEMLDQTISWFLKLNDAGRLSQFIPELKPEKLETLRKIASKVLVQEPKETLRQLHIQAWNLDARQLPLPDGSRDLFVSNNVLQDIPPIIMEGIFAEFRRAAKSNSLHSHFVDMSDMFCHFDPSITNLNFLQFSESTWQLLTNKLQTQNRERIPYYRELFNRAGLHIKEEVNNYANLSDVRKLKLHPKFQSLPVEDVAVLHSHLVASYN
jgi:hypothetical protein